MNIFRYHAKWILTGEHAVIRGYPAIVFPFPSFYCQLTYTPGPHPIQCTSQGDDGLDIVLSGLIHTLANDYSTIITGSIIIHNCIPIGQGLGFSAALSVAVVRLFQSLGHIKKDECYLAAKHCENHFHTISSGIDICGVMSDVPLYFQQGKSTPLSNIQLPNLHLHATEQIGMTSACIHNVATLHRENPIRAKQIDQKMAASTKLAQQALTNSTIHHWIQAIEQAYQCFLAWGLITPCLNRAISDLKQQGCLAVKPTGSGKGGYLIGLWPNNHQPKHSINLQKLYQKP